MCLLIAVFGTCLYFLGGGPKPDSIESEATILGAFIAFFGVSLAWVFTAMPGILVSFKLLFLTQEQLDEERNLAMSQTEPRYQLQPLTLGQLDLLKTVLEKASANEADPDAEVFELLDLVRKTRTNAIQLKHQVEALIGR